MRDGSLPVGLVFPDARPVTKEGFLGQVPMGQYRSGRLPRQHALWVGVLSLIPAMRMANSMLGIACGVQLGVGLAGGLGCTRELLGLRSARPRRPQKTQAVVHAMLAPWRSTRDAHVDATGLV